MKDAETQSTHLKHSENQLNVEDFSDKCTWPTFYSNQQSNTEHVRTDCHPKNTVAPARGTNHNFTYSLLYLLPRGLYTLSLMLSKPTYSFFFLPRELQSSSKISRQHLYFISKYVVEMPIQKMAVKMANRRSTILVSSGSPNTPVLMIDVPIISMSWRQ